MNEVTPGKRDGMSWVRPDLPRHALVTDFPDKADSPPGQLFKPPNQVLGEEDPAALYC